MVTAETALTIPAILAVTALLVAALGLIGERGAACTLAGQVGRAQAVGETYGVPERFLVAVVEENPLQIRVRIEAKSWLTQWLPAGCEVVVRREEK